MRDETLHHLGGCIAIVYRYCITHMYTEWGLQYLVCVLSYNIQLTLNNNISNISLHRCWCVNDGETGIRSSLRGVKIAECQLKCCRITRHNGTRDRYTLSYLHRVTTGVSPPHHRSNISSSSTGESVGATSQ